MSRSVSIDAMNKISYCLTYHSFLFYISKLLFVTVTLYFCIHFHLAPVEGLFFKPKYRANILCICFNFIAVLFLFLSSPWGSVYRFCTVSYENNPTDSMSDQRNRSIRMTSSPKPSTPAKRGQKSLGVHLGFSSLVILLTTVLRVLV